MKFHNTTCNTSIWTSIQVQVVCKVEHDKKILRSYIASVMRLALCKDFTLLTDEDIVRSKRGRPCNIATLCVSSVQLRERVWYCNPCKPTNLKWASTVKKCCYLIWFLSEVTWHCKYSELGPFQGTSSKLLFFATVVLINLEGIGWRKKNLP